MFNLPALENVEEVVIDQSVVQGRSEPMMIYSKKQKKQDKTSAA